jgi:hypothetical protein
VDTHLLSGDGRKHPLLSWRMGGIVDETSEMVGWGISGVRDESLGKLGQRPLVLSQVEKYHAACVLVLKC